MAAIMHTAFYLAERVDNHDLAVIFWLDTDVYWLGGDHNTFVMLPDGMTAAELNYPVPSCWQPVRCNL